MKKFNRRQKIKRIYIIKEKNKWNMITEEKGHVVSTIQKEYPAGILFITLENILKNFSKAKGKIQIISFNLLGNRKAFKCFYTNQGGRDFDKIFKKKEICAYDFFWKKYLNKKIQISLFKKLCNLRLAFRQAQSEMSKIKIGRPTNMERYKKHKNLKNFEKNKARFQPSEKSIQIKIMKYLKTVDSLWVKKISDKFVKGIPDIIGCYKGKFIAFEVKKPGGVLTAYQKFEISKIQNAGGSAMKVDDLQQVKDFFKKR